VGIGGVGLDGVVSPEFAQEYCGVCLSCVILFSFSMKSWLTVESKLGNRWMWGIIMAQLTLARFRGDTTFGLAARIMATFSGGLVGTAMWYIASGNGIASPYGFAAVCAVCFPVR